MYKCDLREKQSSLTLKFTHNTFESSLKRHFKSKIHKHNTSKIKLTAEFAPQIFVKINY